MSTPRLPTGLPTYQSVPGEVDYTATATDTLPFIMSNTATDASSMSATASDTAITTYAATAVDVDGS